MRRRALLSPVAVVLGVAGGVGVAVAGGPVTGAIAAGVAAYGVGVAASAARRPATARRGRVDPFTLGEPWRRHVQHALSARARFDRAVEGTAPGPLRERLVDIGRRVADGVEESWQVAQRGDQLDDAAGQVRGDEAKQRLRAAVEDTRQRLASLDERLQDAVDRALELSMSSSGVAELGSTVDDVVDELEALRAALEETGGTPSVG